MNSTNRLEKSWFPVYIMLAIKVIDKLGLLRGTGIMTHGLIKCTAIICNTYPIRRRRFDSKSCPR